MRPIQVKSNYLTESMDAGIRPPGSQNGAPFPAQAGQGNFDDPLHRPLVHLALEARELCAVV